MMTEHYYYQKYPYLNYDFRDYNGLGRMFSVPPELLVSTFLRKFGRSPKTFFDCGAAIGEIVWRASKLGLDARGIDIKRYPYQNAQLADLFTKGKITICSILNHKPVKADIVFCNGTLTYFTENDIPRVLEKFHDSGMLFAIHNTTEDIEAANAQNCTLSRYPHLRLTRPQSWWTETFDKNGFETEYNTTLQCFCATPRKMR
jgi:hypothetical protein